jgi:sensor c-di-GMP phosphodiesterase-like protein
MPLWVGVGIVIGLLVVLLVLRKRRIQNSQNSK